jgi:hypothetical protein
MPYSRIGGELEINPAYLKPGETEFNPKGILLASGRMALDVILKYLSDNKKINEILYPGYLCDSLIGVAVNNNLKITFYQLDKYFHIDKASFPKDLENKAVLLINYFGLIDTSEDILFLKKNTSRCSIILDNVQAFFEMFSDTKADFVFASIRKFFPVPDGGWLIANDREFKFEFNGTRPELLFSKNKLLGGILKHYSNSEEMEDDIFQEFLEEGEDYLDNYQSIEIISREALCILSNINFEHTALQRIANANFVLENLQQLNIRTLFPIASVSSAPFAIPVKVKNRDKVWDKFADNKIYLLVHWPVAEYYKDRVKPGYDISKEELSLIIDQRYNQNDLSRMFEVLNSCKAEKLV